METQNTCELQKLTRKDFASNQTVRWCPGCGDYAILSAIQNTLPQLGKKKEDFVFVSGIGCSSRFPYYMDTYGFHTIHGRAPAVASGVKIANPDLDVWVISGDGDSYSIGGNHFIHAIRRNVGLKYVVFNNQIYGLTKGQYSPTSQTGLVTKSSPYGNIDRPFNPAALAIGAGCTFYARVIDMSPKEMTEVFLRAAKHKGTALVEVLQNCVIFNDKTHAAITAKDVRADRLLKLEDGKPMLFGENRDKGLVLDGMGLKIVRVGVDGVSESDVLVHDASIKNSNYAFALAQLAQPDFPVPIGVFRDVVEPVYEEVLVDQIAAVRAKKPEAKLSALLRGDTSWEVS